MTDAPQTYAYGNQVEDDFGMSQGVRAGQTVHISGQYAHTGDGALLGAGDFAVQLENTLDRLDQVIGAFGATRNQIAETTVYVVGFQKHTEAVAAAHSNYFGEYRPTTTVVGVSELMPDQLVEISAIVQLDLPR